MWLFPWLTYAVIGFIAVALVIMVAEGTYRTEVVYTSILAAVIVTMGVIAQKFGIGTGRRPPEVVLHPVAE